MNDLSWEKRAQEIFELLIEKTPVFLRAMARDKVLKKIVSLIQSEDRTEVTEKDVVDAFFAETPFGFHGPMKMDMEAMGVDYKKYGHA